MCIAYVAGDDSCPLPLVAGVGQLVEQSELNGIVAPNFDRVFLFDNFVQLNGQLENITVDVCETGRLPCGTTERGRWGAVELLLCCSLVVAVLVVAVSI